MALLIHDHSARLAPHMHAARAMAIQSHTVIAEEAAVGHEKSIQIEVLQAETIVNGSVVCHFNGIV